MSKVHPPSPETVQRLLRYEPESGKLFWNTREPGDFADGKKYSASAVCARWNARLAGKEALAAPHIQGYRHGTILNTFVLAHRAAWAITHGEWPADQVDHINGDKTDNRLANLRAATNQENGRNQKLPTTNTSGHIGVSWEPRRGCWQVGIRAHGRRKHLGRFADLNEAIAARKTAEKFHGFHENHGRRAEGIH